MENTLPAPTGKVIGVRLTAEEIARLDAVCTSLSRKRGAAVKICFREYFPVMEAEAREKEERKARELAERERLKRKTRRPKP